VKLRKAGVVLGSVAMVMAAVALSAQIGVAQSDNNSDVMEIRHYKLTLDKAQKAATAIQSINQMIASNPSLNATLNAGPNGDKPITQVALEVDTRFPQIAAIIKQNGLATREFFVLMGAIMNDVAMVGMKKQGAIKEYPAGMITPENAALIESNWDAFQAIGEKMTPTSGN